MLSKSLGMPSLACKRLLMLVSRTGGKRAIYAVQVANRCRRRPSVGDAIARLMPPSGGGRPSRDRGT
jgi:hypothetical protein